jgi:hypothetical protein
MEFYLLDLKTPSIPQYAGIANLIVGSSFSSNVSPQKVSSHSFLYSNILSHELHKLNTVFQDERNCIFSGPWRVCQVYGSYIKGVDFMDGVGEDGYKGLFRYSQVLLKEIG